MQKHEHYGHRARIRDRVKKEGIENFQDYQVLEYALSFVIPYKDTNSLAHRLINRFGSLGGVLEADEEALQEIDGMGEVSSHFLTSIIKIYNYYEKEKVNRITHLNNPKETHEYVRGLFAGKIVEELYIVSLTPKNKIVKTEKIAQGTMGEAKVTIRTITDNISRNKVNDVIIVHNHPEGECTPSSDDDNFTKALVTSLALNDCLLVDHMILADNNEYYSYRESGRIDKYLKEISGFVPFKIAQGKSSYIYKEKEIKEVKDDKE